MIEKLDEYETYLAIVGFRNCAVKDLGAVLGLLRCNARATDVQMFDADRVAGTRHLLFAAINALNSFRCGRNISKSLAVEVLLFASGQRQIKKAIEAVGVRLGTRNVAVLAMARTRSTLSDLAEKAQRALRGNMDDSILNKWSRRRVRLIRKIFSICDLELETMVQMSTPVEEALEKLVIERGAMLLTESRGSSSLSQPRARR